VGCAQISTEIYYYVNVYGVGNKGPNDGVNQIPQKSKVDKK